MARKRIGPNPIEMAVCGIQRLVVDESLLIQQFEVEGQARGARDQGPLGDTGIAQLVQGGTPKASIRDSLCRA